MQDQVRIFNTAQLRNTRYAMQDQCRPAQQLQPNLSYASNYGSTSQQIRHYPCGGVLEPQP